LGYYLMFAQQDEQAWVSTIENTQTQSWRWSNLMHILLSQTEFEYVNENVVIDNKKLSYLQKRIQDNILSLYYLPNL
jgi:hypothetical protein